ncbi:unnamed protein product [Durusdinium trenchii]|uniref:Sphingomyelin synthase-like domain-containing protein n=1 Tax=Durusdinium trenchii TaxID=1381693 RepID=A0ABP0IRW9_9DINO
MPDLQSREPREMVATAAAHDAEDLQRPIHRSHKSMTVPLRPDVTDPYGWQARLALMQCPTCPLETLHGGRGTDPQEKLRQMLQKAHKDVSELIDAEKKSISDEPWRKLIDQYLAHKTPEQQSQLTEAMGKSDTDVKQLLALSMIYRKLSEEDMKCVRRVSVYPRQLADEEMDESNYKTDAMTKAWYVVFPMALFFFCFSFQSFMLHIGTAFYVRYMERIEGALPEGTDLHEVEGGELFDLVARTVALSAGNESSGDNENEAVRDGNVRIPMFILDLSGFIPAALCVSAFVYSSYKQRFHVGLWYKTFLIACCMAVMKGILDVVTILPDSIGWNQCKERLGEPALQKMRNRHFFSNFWGSIWQALIDEVIGVNGKRIRYCADMMLSGHTYFAALFSLAAYKLTGAIDLSSKAQKLVGVVCIICVTVEVVLVAAARFHYTVDMITSVFLVCLLWDSLFMEQVSSDWSEGYSWRDPLKFYPRTCFWKDCGETYQPSQRVSLNREAPPGVLPSQATYLINMRMLSGRPSWDWEEAGGEDSPPNASTANEMCPLICPSP